MKELFVCEKPSQAENYAEAISGKFTKKKGFYEGADGRVYTFAFGHLLGLQPQEGLSWNTDINQLPFFKKDIELLIKEESKSQYYTIVDLMKKAQQIIVATDAGREGEHIFSKIYRKSNLNKPYKRLWVSEQTDKGIRKAYEDMKDGSHYEGIALAGKLREEADFLIGLNATLLATTLSGNKTTISYGRVQTPTLAMIVARDKEIENFKKVEHFTIAAPVYENTFELQLGKDEKLTKEQAESIMSQLGNRSNLDVVETSTSEKPPHLFDLTSLQMYMNGEEGWSAQKTLDVLQSLYEKHKAVTYPRTSSKYISSSDELPFLLAAHDDVDMVKRVLDNGYSIEKSFVNPEEVTDHEAIIITEKKPKNPTKDEATLYSVVLTRFIAAFYPKAQYKNIKATFQDGEHSFAASSKVLVSTGWKALYGKEIGQESRLSNISLNAIGEYLLKRKETKPAARYTQKTLLEDMDNASKFLSDKEDKKILKKIGIGTSATRASIIETLFKRKFIEEKNGKGKSKQIVSTPLGREVVGMMPESFLLYSPALTAIFESYLSQVESKEMPAEEFYKELKGLVDGISKELKANMKQITVQSSVQAKESVCACPTCGKPIYENSKAYSCSGFKDGCTTVVWKNGLEKFGKKKIGIGEARKLLNGETVQVTLKSSKLNTTYKKNVKFDFNKNWVTIVR